MQKAILLICLMVSCLSMAQDKISGKVVDQSGNPLSKSYLSWTNHNAYTNSSGGFDLHHLPSKPFDLNIALTGYVSQVVRVDLRKTTFITVVLAPDDQQLDELVIDANKSTSVNSITYKQSAIRDHFSGSLAKSLETIPGVTAMDIGSGLSKPMIRGLGFNRLAVTENGVKQEDQQWGADHGLEIDALQTEEVEVIKGVGAIAYGSDAIAGVIRINNEIIPSENGTSGNILLHGKTGNDALGASFLLKHRKDNFFYKVKFSGVDFADYRVPTNQINYLNTKIPIYNNRLKNTAGNEYALYLQGGYISDHFQSILSVSNMRSKSGFFPGAHGIPSVGAVVDDGNYRNVDMPYQETNHFKVTSSNKWTENNQVWNLIFAFQQNHRQEWSSFHSHYANQKPPEVNPNLELDFVLNTLSTQLDYSFDIDDRFETSLGLQQNTQINNVSGYSYLLPKFDTNAVGFFAKQKWFVNSNLTLDYGARLDFSKIKTVGYFDSLLYDYLLSVGNSTTTAKTNATRSTDVNREYLQANAAVGLLYEIAPKWKFSATMGSNFRNPTAMELSANGIHHGAFRHERGNSNLNPEKGISAELGLKFKSNGFQMELTPFVYYFSNYIFLKPTGEFSVLPHGGQVYAYEQSKALITGFEWTVKKDLNRFTIEATFEYLYSKQLDNVAGDYPLPFSTPMNLYGEVSYRITEANWAQNNKIFVTGKWVAEQNRIAQNEAVTQGYTLLGAGVNTDLTFGTFRPTIRLQATNLLNIKYYNHASFYRAIEIPEMGRSVQLMVQIPF